jgi:hypothetical protein
MNRSALLVALTAGLLLSAFPAVAGATDYCVGAPGCDPTNNLQSFQTALGKAAAGNDADRIFLGAGTYTAPVTGFSYGAGGPVEIVGTGQSGLGATVITGPAGATGHVLELMGGPGTSVHDVRIVIPQNVAPPVLTALQTNGTASRITVYDDAASQVVPRNGVLLSGGTLEDSFVLLGANSAGVVLPGYGETVRDARITAELGVSSYGGALERNSVVATNYGILARGGQTTIRSSEFRVQSGTATGIYASAQSGYNPTVIADGVNVLGHGDPGTTGVRASTSAAPASNATVTLTNSLVRSFGTPLRAEASGSGVGRIDASYSDYDSSKNVTTGTTNAKIAETHVSNVGDVGFADVGDLDYGLLPSSPLVDAGDPATGQGLDFKRHALVTDGNLDGFARRDIGAVELPGPLPGEGTGPPPPGGTPAGPSPDALAPVVTGFISTHRLFGVAGIRRAGAAMARGTRFRYTLSEAARVTIAIQRRRPGGRYRTVGRLSAKATRGVNRIRFSGRIRGRALRPGRYRAVIRATDAAKNRSAPRRARFRIVRSGRR